MIESVGVACTGCGACVSVCPNNCITMEKRDLGHRYPTVDIKKCVNCGKCLRVCHAKRGFTQGGFEGRALAVQAKDWGILKDSSSGGMFTLLASAVLGIGGVVYGSKWCRGRGAIHTRVSSIDELGALRRSKYVYSDIVEMFRLVEQDLNEGIKVLFVGVPCQVAALKTYLGDERDSLITVDLVCHGVPSSGFFEDYLRWFEERTGDILVEYNSRDKFVSGWSCLGSFKTESGVVAVLPVDDPYVLAFSQGASFRECCYECPYAGPRRVGDITLGDFWGVERLHFDLDLDGGVSVVLVNTKNGQCLVERSCKNTALVNDALFEDASRLNANLVRPSAKPIERGQLADAYASGDFASVSTLIKKFYWKEIIKNHIKRSIPKTIKRFIKGAH